MNDEPQLQVTRKLQDSPMVRSSPRSGLVARGRRDAVLLGSPDPVPEEDRKALFDAVNLAFLANRRPMDDVLMDAERGDPEQQNILAWGYLFAPRRKNLVLADKWYRLSSEQGFAPSQFSLGWMHDNAHFGVQDWVEAAKWYRCAADQSFAPAQFNLGAMYDSGEGVGQDFAEAVNWYRRAAEQGLSEAQFNLGLKYERGQGVTRDNEEAVRWYRMAAQRNPSAQFKLGRCYRDGQGVAQDYVQAHMWINLAASRAGVDDQKLFADSRDMIAAKMTAVQVSEAQRLAREWKPLEGTE